MDDFDVKYVGEEHAEHLLQVLRQYYEVDKDESGSKYCGITLDWDYAGKKVHLLMPGYCGEAPVKFGHSLREVTDQPHQHTPPQYGAQVQYAKQRDVSPEVLAQEKQVHPTGNGDILVLCESR